jgi:nucleoside-diphosphate-sugar epimerase
MISMSKKRILVTGGAGYIGSVMVPELLERGHQVTVLDNFFFKQTGLLSVCHYPALRIVPGDVRDKALLSELVSKHDVIIPLAAVVGAPACKKDEQYAAELNFGQIKNIAQMVSQNQEVLFPVTNSGYGIGQEGVYCDENTPLNPISHYGKTKVEAEKILLDMGNAVTFRLATVFGASPRMRMDLLVNDFVYRAYSDRFIVLFESHFKRNYIHIRDVVNAFFYGLDHYEKMKGEPYNVGLSSANLSKMELCLKIREYVPEFHIIESQVGEDVDKRNYIVSNAKIESLGWHPKHTIDMGIAELLKTYSFLPVNQYRNI